MSFYSTTKRIKKIQRAAKKVTMLLVMIMMTLVMLIATTHTQMGLKRIANVSERRVEKSASSKKN